MGFESISVITLTMVFGLVCYVAYRMIMRRKKIKGPRYPQFQATRLQGLVKPSGKYVCPVCHNIFTNSSTEIMSFVVCENCRSLIEDRGILDQYKIPPLVKKVGISDDIIIALNLLEYDTKRDFISKAQARKHGQEIINKIVAQASQYKKS